MRAYLIVPCPPNDGAAVFLIETDSISLIGPTFQDLSRQRLDGLLPGPIGGTSVLNLMEAAPGGIITCTFYSSPARAKAG